MQESQNLSTFDLLELAEINDLIQAGKKDDALNRLKPLASKYPHDNQIKELLRVLVYEGSQNNVKLSPNSVALNKQIKSTNLDNPVVSQLQYSKRVLGTFERGKGKEILEIYKDRIKIKNDLGLFEYQWSRLSFYYHSIVRCSFSINFIPVYWSTKYKFTLQFDGGQIFVFDKSFSDIKFLAELLPDVTFQPLLLRTLEELKNFQSVRFNNVILTPQGLSTGKSFLEWAKVADVVVKEGNIIIYQFKENLRSKKRFVILPFSQTPNSLVLIELIKRLAS
jgi:hypothetical protein